MPALRNLIKVSVLFLFGCTASTHWQLEAVPAGDASFNFSRLKYQEHSLNPLSFELLYTSEGFYAYLNLTQGRICQRAKEPISLNITVSGVTQHFSVIPLQGEMRISLPKEATDWVIEALSQEETVHLVLNNLEQIIKPDQFSDYLKKLTGQFIFMHNPIKSQL